VEPSSPHPPPKHSGAVAKHSACHSSVGCDSQGPDPPVIPSTPEFADLRTVAGARRPRPTLEWVARCALLCVGLALVPAGIVSTDIAGDGVSMLGVIAIALAGMLPRLESLVLFGKHGLGARLSPSPTPSEESPRTHENQLTPGR
jgi:hypothetical protein